MNKYSGLTFVVKRLWTWHVSIRILSEVIIIIYQLVLTNKNDNFQFQEFAEWCKKLIGRYMNRWPMYWMISLSDVTAAAFQVRVCFLNSLFNSLLISLQIIQFIKNTSCLLYLLAEKSKKKQLTKKNFI